jgi:hypothetical protein
MTNFTKICQLLEFRNTAKNQKTLSIHLSIHIVDSQHECLSFYLKNSSAKKS